MNTKHEHHCLRTDQITVKLSEPEHNRKNVMLFFYIVYMLNTLLELL